MSTIPYRDATRPIDDRVDDLLSRMTLEEKAGLLFHTIATMGPGGTLDGGSDPFGTTPAAELVTERHMNHFNLYNMGASLGAASELARWHNQLQELAQDTRLGIPITISTDPRHAFTDNPLSSMRGGPFSQWPETTGLAAIGDEVLVERYADIVRQEYLAVGIRVALHPQVDLATEPRWRRIHGTFGEDAGLTSRLVRAYIRGLQGDLLGPHSVSAMVKHFPGGGPQRDGNDPHFSFGRDQVYPGAQFDYHLRPFQAAIEAGCSQIMPYYGVPTGTEYEEVGFGFNKDVITTLLRERLRFKGIVCTDWGLITDSSLMGHPFPARAWGVEHLSRIDRVRKAIEAGVDQFGGEACPELVIELVRTNQVSENRVDASARRLLREKFALGLFDKSYVDEDAADAIVGRDDFVQAGVDAQRASVTILHNTGLLPLRAADNLYIEGVERAIAAKYTNIVDDPDDADVVVVRIKAPYGQPRETLEKLLSGDNEGYEDSLQTTFEQIFQADSLEYSPQECDRIMEFAMRAPTVVDVYLDRPAVLTAIIAGCRALVATYGANDAAFLDVLFGRSTPQGRLPFDLPSSMEAIEASRSDVPFDTASPLFRFGHRLVLPSTPRSVDSVGR